MFKLLYVPEILFKINYLKSRNQTFLAKSIQEIFFSLHMIFLPQNDFLWDLNK